MATYLAWPLPVAVLWNSLTRRNPKAGLFSTEAMPARLLLLDSNTLELVMAVATGKSTNVVPLVVYCRRKYSLAEASTHWLQETRMFLITAVLALNWTPAVLLADIFGG